MFDDGAAGADKVALVLARCLGYLIRELPAEANGVVANEVVACNADFEKMKSLSQLYIDHLIRLFRRSKGRTPAPSEHPSRPSFEMHSAFFSEAVEPAPMDHRSAKKCIKLHVHGTGRLTEVQFAPKPSPRTCTHYCHIFPPSTNWSFDLDDPAEKKKKYAGNVWTIIENFRCIVVLSELDGAKIHHLGNGFTMNEELHSMFDDLSLWFEEVANNTYRVRALDPGVGLLTILPPHRTITFTSTDPHLPLPNPEYLRLHAAVCRIAHLSGVASYLDLEDREVERSGVLARDGSSADLLASRLRCVALVA
ncbi:hypothetical protein AN958_05310 [Leucoagaricus sp. SymC.cos]|nr:hypothetical protein AN958_05310 [Leucoagaricus sp. SymC.cos]